MYCFKCGQPLVDNAAFCSHCGAGQKQQGRQPVSPAFAPLVAEAPAATQAQWRPVSPPPAHIPPVQQPAASQPTGYSTPAATVPPAASPPVPVVWSSNARTGTSVRPRKNKTAVDILCGIIFLALGLLALGSYGVALFNILTEGGLRGLFPVFSSFSNLRFLSSLLSLGYIFGLIAGLLMALGGVFALLKGRGRKPAYAAIVLMLFTLLFDAVYLFLMNFWGHMPQSIGSAIVRSLYIYLFEVLFVLVPTVLLFFKRRAKKRLKAASAIAMPQGHGPVPVPASTELGNTPTKPIPGIATEKMAAPALTAMDMPLPVPAAILPSPNFMEKPLPAPTAAGPEEAPSAHINPNK